MYQYNAEVVKVIDSSTFEFMADLGFSVYKKVKIKLKGVGKIKKELSAREFIEKSFGNAFKVVIQSHVAFGKEDGYTADVYIFFPKKRMDDTVRMENLSEFLVANGYAKGGV